MTASSWSYGFGGGFTTAECLEAVASSSSLMSPADIETALQLADALEQRNIHPVSEGLGAAAVASQTLTELATEKAFVRLPQDVLSWMADEAIRQDAYDTFADLRAA